MFRFSKFTLLTLAAFCVFGLTITANAKPGDGDAPPAFDVNVVNTPLEVEGIVDVVSKAITPYREKVSLQLSSGESFKRSEFFEVPEGKRLVIEHFACGIGILYHPDALQCAIEDTDYGAHYIPTAYTMGLDGTVSSGGPLKVIYDEFESFAVFARWNAPLAGAPGLSFAISGYLEDLE